MISIEQRHAMPFGLEATTVAIGLALQGRDLRVYFD
jgi:hypothetical protein